MNHKVEVGIRIQIHMLRNRCIRRNGLNSGTTQLRYLRLSRSPTGNHYSMTQRVSFRGIKRGLILTGLAVGATTAAVLTADEGLRRTAYYVGNLIVPLMRYRFVEWQVSDLPPAEQEKHYQYLHDIYCNEPLRVILELKGFYIKMGQVMSSMNEELPKQYIDSLKILQENVPPRPYSEIKAIIESEFNEKVEHIFKSFEEKPIGAASIGQVHRAVLKDGTPVVVKVQYPEVEEYFYMDFLTVKGFVWWTKPSQLPLMEEVEKQFKTEFDYTREARNIRAVSENLVSLPDVAVPTPIDAVHPSNTVKGGLCTKKVLTMTLLRGQALQKKLDIQMEKFAKLQGMSVDELKLKMRKQMLSSTSQSVTPPSPYVIKAFNYYLYLRDLTKNTWAWVYNSVYQPILGGPLFPYETSEPPMNGTTLTYTIWRAHAHQLFTDGFLNGDPHPGNIMILDDGRVGLIDFGQMQKVSVESRILIAKLILAIKANNSEKIVSLWAQMGFKTKNMDPYVLEKHARVAFDSLGPDVTEGKGFKFFESLEKRDPQTDFPPEFIMIRRMMLLLRLSGLGMSQGHVSGVKMLAPYTKEFLVNQGQSLDVSTF